MHLTMVSSNRSDHRQQALNLSKRRGTQYHNEKRHTQRLTMHELGITQNLLSLALQYADPAGAKKITALHLVFWPSTE